MKHIPHFKTHAAAADAASCCCCCCCSCDLHLHHHPLAAAATAAVEKNSKPDAVEHFPVLSDRHDGVGGDVA